DVHVVIADQRLGGSVTGTQFLQRVKDLHPDTLRVVLSGYTDLEAATDSVNRGSVYKVLLKPCDNEALRTEIGEAFWHQELSRASTGSSGRRPPDHGRGAELHGGARRCRACLPPVGRPRLIVPGGWPACPRVRRWSCPRSRTAGAGGRWRASAGRLR